MDKDPVASKPIAMLLLAQLMTSMTRTDFETFIVKSPDLTDAERRTLLALLEKHELGPARGE